MLPEINIDPMSSKGGETFRFELTCIPTASNITQNGGEVSVIDRIALSPNRISHLEPGDTT